jgi:hypothetical protein
MTAQDCHGIGLVVNGVECGDEVERARFGCLVEITQVARNKLDVPVGALVRLGSRKRDRFLRQEPALRELCGQQVDGFAASATNVENANTLLEPSHKAGR